MSTATTIEVAGDVTEYVQSGDAYRIIDYHLQFGSPAIDSGSASGAPSTDIEGIRRPIDIPGLGVDRPGVGYDIGAYEFTHVMLSILTDTRSITVGDEIEVSWRLDKKTAGTAVSLRLWRNGQEVADLGDQWHPLAAGVANLRLPHSLIESSQYRIRAISLWDHNLWAETDPFTMHEHHNAVDHRYWNLYP